MDEVHKKSRKRAELLMPQTMSCDSGDRVSAHEGDVRRLLLKENGSGLAAFKSDTCTFPSHTSWKYPAVEKECFFLWKEWVFSEARISSLVPYLDF